MSTITPESHDTKSYNYQLSESITKCKKLCQPRSQGLSSLSPLSFLNDNGGREERPCERGWKLCMKSMVEKRQSKSKENISEQKSLDQFISSMLVFNLLTQKILLDFDWLGWATSR